MSVLERAMKMEILPSDFEKLRAEPDFGQILCDLDVSDEDQYWLFDTIDADCSGTIDLGELLNGIAKLRGEARRSDIVALTLRLSSVQQDLKQHIAEIETMHKG